MGDRATEVAVVLVEFGRVVDRFQSLMNPGVPVSPFIAHFTGITNAMLAMAPDSAHVMAETSRFVGRAPLVAHNAAFDAKFWRAELQRIDHPADHAFVCTLLVSRRLYPQAPSHKLGELAKFHRLPALGRAHRALADAEMAAALLNQIQTDLHQRFGVKQPDHKLLMALQRCAKPAVAGLMANYAETNPR